MIKIIRGKKYEVVRGGCWACAFKGREGEYEYCTYAEEVNGVLQFECKLKFGEHYEEVSDDKNN